LEGLVSQVEATESYHNTAAVASSNSITDPSTLAEQFQKFLSLQPQAVSTSSSIG